MEGQDSNRESTCGVPKGTRQNAVRDRFNVAWPSKTNCRQKYLMEPTHIKSHPVKILGYRARSNVWDLEGMKIENKFSMNINEPTKTKWDVSVLLVPNKHGSLRFFVDHQQSSGVTTPNIRAIPKINDGIYFFGNVKILSMLLTQGCKWQLKIGDEDRYRKAFYIAPQQLMLPQNVKFAIEGTWHGSSGIDVILAPVMWQFALVYSDLYRHFLVESRTPYCIGQSCIKLVEKGKSHSEFGQAFAFYLGDLLSRTLPST